MSPHSEAILECSNTSGADNDSTEALAAKGSQYSVNQAAERLYPLLNGSPHPQSLNARARPSPYLLPAALSSEFDLICVGFGPASVAIAAAIHDSFAFGDKQLLSTGRLPKVLFIEKNTEFSWHSGMLLPGSKMQISFMKDLATLRDPRSEFTFLNYLFCQGRLVDFINLGTFLPTRKEYEDYLRWCSYYFERLVQFNQEVVSISPNQRDGEAVRSFTIKSHNIATGNKHLYCSKKVLLATGGQPRLPKGFPLDHPRIIHSSQYWCKIKNILGDANSPYRAVVIGSGQSAAEIFRHLQSTYINSETRLVMRSEHLRPSDDSPFINRIFNPEYVDVHFEKSAQHRVKHLDTARATNYGVVRLQLIEELYEKMYDQIVAFGQDQNSWPHQILGGRCISNIEAHGDIVQVKIQRIQDENVSNHCAEETIGADVVIAATGYDRNSHVELLRDLWSMLPRRSLDKDEFIQGISGWSVQTELGERIMKVSRDYKIMFNHGQIAKESGIWLQGCCEGTHGLSDTLLSVLSTRSKELVNSLFHCNN